MCVNVNVKALKKYIKKPKSKQKGMQRGVIKRCWLRSGREKRGGVKKKEKFSKALKRERVCVCLCEKKREGERFGINTLEHNNINTRQQQQF